LALLDVDYIKRKMSTSTFLSIFDDANAADGSFDEDAVDDNIADAEAAVYSWVARNYPNLTIPVTADPPPTTLRLAAFGFFYVFARDRKPEYWSKSQENERKDRLKAAYDLVENYAKATQILFDTGGAPPANVGGVVRSGDPDDIDPKPKFFADGTGDF
jgi:hypothetical protein